MKNNGGERGAGAAARPLLRCLCSTGSVSLHAAQSPRRWPRTGCAPLPLPGLPLSPCALAGDPQAWVSWALLGAAANPGPAGRPRRSQTGVCMSKAICTHRFVPPDTGLRGNSALRKGEKPDFAVRAFL